MAPRLPRRHPGGPPPPEGGALTPGWRPETGSRAVRVPDIATVARRSDRRIAITTKKDADDRAAARIAAGRAARLERLKAEAKREHRSASRASRADARRGAPSRERGSAAGLLGELAWFAVRLAVPVLLPFATLVGGSTWSHRLLGLPTWGALGLAALLTAGCLTLFGVHFTRALHARYRTRRLGWRFGMRIALPIVVAYCGYTLLYLARENAKTDAVRAYHGTLHPLMRVALGTAILADPAIVVTDTRREAADYDRMGLRAREHSLHFTQPDGYVHAVDLRTAGRSWIRIAAVRAWFGVMGFRTLRHVGTADHLHVSLPMR